LQSGNTVTPLPGTQYDGPTVDCARLREVCAEAARKINGLLNFIFLGRAIAALNKSKRIYISEKIRRTFRRMRCSLGN
jgi:hypothetical protein